MFHKRMFAAAIMLVVSCTMMMATINSMGIAEKQTINFTAPTLMGSTVLPAGQYSVTHQMNGQAHIMIFKQVKGTAEVRANCSLLPLKEKAQHTEQRYTVNAQDQRVLQQITFQGDMATHVLAQQPGSEFDSGAAAKPPLTSSLWRRLYGLRDCG
jgi:hypothetical protein